MTEWQERRWRWTFYAACAAFVIAFYAWYWDARSFDYCEGEKTWPCIREWAFMFSGWGTVLGGGFAAFYVYQTILKMNEQTAEARRQTAFMLGDELPTLELKSKDAFDGAYFRIINWNRRSFIIQEIRWIVNGLPVPLKLVEGESGTVIANIVDNDTLYPNLRVDGWENRNAGPPEHRTLHARVATGTAFDMEDDVMESVGMVRVVGQLAGEPNVQYTIHTGEVILDIFER